MFRELTRKHKQLPHEESVRLLCDETRGVLSVIGDEGYPYGMPMNHLYHTDGKLYFHSGMGGHREEALTACDKASFCVYDRGERLDGDWAYTVKSVIVFGRVKKIVDEQTIREIATALSHKFTQDDVYIRREIEQFASRTVIWCLTPEHICGKIIKEA